MNISVIGLGKLGLCTAACLAAKGHRVIGVEKNKLIRDALIAGQCPIQETGLPELLHQAWKNLSVTSDPDDAVSFSDITFVIVPTPSLSNGCFTNEYIEAALREVAPPLARIKRFHVVCVVSTVMPGSCEKVFRTMLESLTGKQCGKDFGLVYNPEFIALGSVIRDFLYPDMVLIGESDSQSGALVEELYRSFCEKQPCIARMGLVSAEITKLALNCFVTMKISFVNELASVVEHVPEADVDAIAHALGADSRIGSKYLRAGLGFGGPCFPRDNLAFQAFAEQYGVNLRLPTQVISINHSVLDRLYLLTTRKLKPNDHVAILGLAYKAFSPVVEQSQSVMLAQRLSEANYSVSVHDPWAMQTTRDVLNDLVTYAPDPYAATKGAGAIALLTSWPEYGSLDWKRIAQSAKPGAVLVDAWRTLRSKELHGLQYLALGLGEES